MVDNSSTIQAQAPLRTWWTKNRNPIILIGFLVALPFLLAVLNGQSMSSLLANETGQAKFYQGLLIEIFILAVFALLFAVGLSALLAIGWYAYRRTTSTSDYFLGGRTLGPWPAALSAGASDMSGWLLLGLPGYAFASGMESVWLTGGLLTGTYLNWRWVAKRLRTYSYAAEDALTLPEYFANRFADGSHALQAIAACFVLLFFLFYTSQFHIGVNVTERFTVFSD